MWGGRRWGPRGVVRRASRNYSLTGFLSFIKTQSCGDVTVPAAPGRGAAAGSSAPPRKAPPRTSPAPQAPPPRGPRPSAPPRFSAQAALPACVHKTHRESRVGGDVIWLILQTTVPGRFSFRPTPSALMISSSPVVLNAIYMPMSPKCIFPELTASQFQTLSRAPTPRLHVGAGWGLHTLHLQNPTPDHQPCLSSRTPVLVVQAQTREPRAIPSFALPLPSSQAGSTSNATLHWTTSTLPQSHHLVQAPSAHLDKGSSLLIASPLCS